MPRPACFLTDVQVQVIKDKSISEITSEIILKTNSTWDVR